jgi:hypothetical protein
MKKMITTNMPPPIPDRRYDWCAYWDGEEEEGHCGWGKTKEEAIEDLRRLDQEKWEEENPEEIEERE